MKVYETTEIVKHVRNMEINIMSSKSKMLKDENTTCTMDAMILHVLA